MPVNDFTIEYSVTNSPDGTLLHIWEKKSHILDEDNCYLYQIRYKLSPKITACEVINYLLLAAGAEPLSPRQFAMLRGKLKVISNPTLKLRREKIYNE